MNAQTLDADPTIRIVTMAPPLRGAPNYSNEQLNNIPAEFKAQDRWCVFRISGGTKIPYIPGTRTKASPNDAKTWRSYDDALNAVQQADCYLGFILNTDTGVTFLDLDKAVLRDGELHPAARGLIDTLDSYTEFSVSGNGVHILSTGLPPRTDRDHYIDAQKVEVYGSSNRAILITGDCRPGIGAHDRQLHDRAAEVASLFPPQPHADRTAASSSTDALAERLAESDATLIVGALLPHWIEGERHTLSLGLTGWLAKSHVPEDQAEEIIDQLGIDDEDFEDRLRAVRDTYARFEGGEDVQGYRGVASVLREKDPAALALVAEILDTHKTHVAESHGEPAPVTQEERDRCHAIPVPDFPLDIFPPSVRQYLAEAAESTSVPPEMVAGPFMAFTGALIGNRLALGLKSSWRAYPGLFVAVVAPPGAAKTPALNVAKWPLEQLQKAAFEAYGKAKARYAEESAEQRKKEPKNRDLPPTEPELRHYCTTNITIEALGALLEAAPGIAVVHDELSGWVASMDQYKGKGSDRQAYLSVFSSTQIKVDRRGSATIFCPSPVVSVVGGIQPDLVKTLHTATGARDGFVERVLPMVPRCEAAPWNDVSISKEASREVMKIYNTLDRLPPIGIADDAGSATISLSDGAMAVWRRWYNENNTVLIPGAPGLAAGFYLKLQSYVPRFALILHALHNADDPWQPVSAERMQDAIALAEFFRAHIHRFLALLGTDTADVSGGLWARVEKALHREATNTPEGWVPRSQLSRSLGNGVNAELLTTTLAAMLENGTVEKRRRITSTKSAEEWRQTPKKTQ